jgi:hypothetical protein
VGYRAPIQHCINGVRHDLESDSEPKTKNFSIDRPAASPGNSHMSLILPVG